MKNIFLLVLLISCASFAQITIESSDVSSIYTVGNSVRIYEDTSQTSIDIGSPGGGNNWDFSMLQSVYSEYLESVDPVTTPYINDFPGANICTHSLGSVQGFQAEIWSYLKVNGNFENMGWGAEVSPDTVVKLTNSPAEIQAELPLTINSNWTQNLTSSISIEITGLPPITIQSTVDNVFTVDAFGTMTLPGGVSFEALRIREENTIATPPFPGETIVTYTFQAKNGAQVVVEAMDTNPPNSGTISVDWTSYNFSPTSSVEQISGLPQNFNLTQNFPNPFNPTTKIEYSIPQGSFVQLKVYDILGNEVATVVNQEQNAGTYRADFNAENLASGFYIARLQAGNYTKSIKMTLLR